MNIANDKNLLFKYIMSITKSENFALEYYLVRGFKGKFYVKQMIY